MPCYEPSPMASTEQDTPYRDALAAAQARIAVLEQDTSLSRGDKTRIARLASLTREREGIVSTAQTEDVPRIFLAKIGVPCAIVALVFAIDAHWIGALLAMAIVPLVWFVVRAVKTSSAEQSARHLAAIDAEISEIEAALRDA